MLGIIYKKNELQDASVLLKILLESGEVKKVKVPGILKSRKRTGYFLAPATLWNFTFSGNEKEVMIPKEYSLVLSPFDFNSSYNELLLLMESMKLLNTLKQGAVVVGVFSETEKFLKDWQAGKLDENCDLINFFYLRFLDLSGLLHFSEKCIHCGEPISPDGIYHLFSGSSCSKCLLEIPHGISETLPNQWIQKNLKKDDDKPERSSTRTSQDSEFRQRIYNFLSHES